MNRTARRDSHEFIKIFSHLKSAGSDDDSRESYWQPLLDSYHEDIPFSYWMSQYSTRPAHAIAMTVLQMDMEGIIKVLYRRRNENATEIASLHPRLPDELVLHELNAPEFLAYNERLYSRWMMLFLAMAGSNCWGTFSFENIGMPNALLDLMTNALSKEKSNRSRKYIIQLCNTDSGREGDMTSLSNFIQRSASLHTLSIRRNPHISFEAASQLSEGIRKHNKCLQRVSFRECGLGRNTRALSTIMNASADLTSLHLRGNGLRSRAAVVIANFLASNPELSVLFLSNNELSDKDAALFAESLKSNTNLKRLFLKNNDFSQSGVDILAEAVFDTTSLNSLFDGNNTCKIFGMPGDDRFKHTQFKHKRLQALCSQTRDSCLNLHYLNDVPVELMPYVLSLIQKSPPKYTTAPLSVVFEAMRTWQLPLLYFYRSSQHRHPQDVMLCVDELVSTLSGDGSNGIDFHTSQLPPQMNGEYDVIVPRSSDGLLMYIGGLDSGFVVFLGYRPRIHGRKGATSIGTAEFFNLIQPGDVITGVNGRRTAGKTFLEVTAMLKHTASYAYLRLEKGRSFNDRHYPQTLEIIRAV